MDIIQNAPSLSDRWIGRLTALLWLVRPGNILMIGAGVVVGRILTGDVLASDPMHLLAVVCAACLVGAGANISNDIYDKEIDAKNKPERPLAAGRTSIAAALVSAVLLTIGGLLLATFVSATHLLFAALIVALLWFYNIRLKRVAVVGNVVVALCVAASLLFGAMGNGIDTVVMAGSVFAFLLTLGREIIKDVEDVEGDAALGAKTLSVLVGPETGKKTASVIVFVAATLAPLPYLILDFSSSYLAIVVFADAWLLAAVWRLVSGRDGKEDVRAASFSLKAAMFFGLLALVFSRGVPV